MSAWLCSDHIIALCTPLPHTHTHRQKERHHPENIHWSALKELTHTHIYALKPGRTQHARTHSRCSIWQEADRSHMQVCPRVYAASTKQRLPPAHPHSEPRSERARDTDVRKGRGEKRQSERWAKNERSECSESQPQSSNSIQLCYFYSSFWSIRQIIKMNHFFFTLLLLYPESFAT